MTRKPSVVRLESDNPHHRAYRDFLRLLLSFMRERRGRQSRLARHLQTRRQSVSRWFTTPHAHAPAWAALAANVWLHRQLTPEERRRLSAIPCPPGQRQLPHHNATQNQTSQLHLC